MGLKQFSSYIVALVFLVSVNGDVPSNSPYAAVVYNIMAQISLSIFAFIFLANKNISVQPSKGLHGLGR